MSDDSSENSMLVALKEDAKKHLEDTYKVENAYDGYVLLTAKLKSKFSDSTRVKSNFVLRPLVERPQRVTVEVKNRTDPFAGELVFFVGVSLTFLHADEKYGYHLYSGFYTRRVHEDDDMSCDIISAHVHEFTRQWFAEHVHAVCSSAATNTILEE